MTRRSTTEEFIAKSRKVHGEKYNYSVTDYKTSLHYVKIICPVHGIWEQLPKYHLKHGCLQCYENQRLLYIKERAYSFDEFLSKARGVHSDKFEYIKDSFVMSSSKMDIVCKIHGKFRQTGTSHLTGQGCPSCRKCGYCPTKPGFLYVLVCENVTKVGITNLSALERARSVSSSAKKKFEVVTYIKFSDGKVADSIETELLRYLRKHYTKTSESHEGHSECFDDVDYDALQKVILKLCSEFLPTL